MAISALNKLAFRVKLRIRAQRFADTLATALSPALAVAALAALLAKLKWWSWTEFWQVAVAAGTTAVLASILAALWPISLLSVFFRLDRANGFSDRLSSAHAFAELESDEQTPQMQLHIQRTLALLDRVRVAPAHRFRMPPNSVPALLMAVVLVFVGSIAEPPSQPMVAMHPPTVPVAEPIVDPGILLETSRQLDDLVRLAEISEDEELQQISDELVEMMDRLQRGRIGEIELLQRLAEIDRWLEVFEEPQPIGLDSIWDEIQEDIRQVADGPDLPEQMEDVVDALEDGDEGTLAGLMEAMAEVIENQEIPPDLLEEAADLLEELADSIDPTDPDLRRQIEEHQEEIQRLQERLQQRERRRDQRRLDEELERLARASEQIGRQISERGREGTSRREISEAMRNAGEALRDLSEQPAEGQQLDAAEQGEAAGLSGQQLSERPQQSAEEQEAPPDQQGEESPTESSQRGRATSSLEQAAARLRDMEREQALQDGLEQARQTTEDLRENLQRSSQDPSSEESAEQARSNWQSFMDRADGRRQESHAAPNGEAGESDEEAPQPAQHVAHQVGERGEDSGSSEDEAGDDARQTYGDGPGGEILQEEPTRLDSTRERFEQTGVDSEGEAEEMTTSEVFRAASSDGFASRAYQEVYTEYARAAEVALEAEEIPAGFKRFVRRYFQLVEPR